MDKPLHPGGQAVIEGVMMRLQWGYSVAVRGTDGRIKIRKVLYRAWTDRFRLFKLPVLRGATVMIESMVIGIKALIFSAEESADEQENGSGEKGGSKSIGTLGIATSLVIAFSLGMLLFFYIPLWLTDMMGIQHGLWFNLVDGMLRLLFVVGYMWVISLWSEFRRILEYHGAEHKSIGAFEAGRELSVESARTYGTAHPRCGTSFLLAVVVVSLLVFLLMGRPESLADRLLRFAAIPLIAGLSYEAIKLAERLQDGTIGRLILAPGLLLQKLTTREPSDEQIQVAISALESLLEMRPEKVESQKVGSQMSGCRQDSSIV